MKRETAAMTCDGRHHIMLPVSISSVAK